jgi:hypothetical protein
MGLNDPPGADGQFYQQLPVEEKINPQPLGNTEYPLAMGNILQDMGQQPLSIFNTPFLVTGWAKLPALTGARRYS